MTQTTLFVSTEPWKRALFCVRWCGNGIINSCSSTTPHVCVVTRYSFSSWQWQIDTKTLLWIFSSLYYGMNANETQGTKERKNSTFSGPFNFAVMRARLSESLKEYSADTKLIANYICEVTDGGSRCGRDDCGPQCWWVWKWWSWWFYHTKDWWNTTSTWAGILYLREHRHLLDYGPWPYSIPTSTCVVLHWKHEMTRFGQ